MKPKHVVRIDRRAAVAALLWPVALSAVAQSEPSTPASEPAPVPAAVSPAASGTAVVPMPVTPAALGIELVGLRLSGAEFLIDLRYRVRDAAKAQALLERKVQPVLVHEASGRRFYVPQAPKVGSLRQSATSKQPAQVGKVYFMLFANPDRRLRPGEKVTLHAGEHLVKDIVVQ